MTKKTETLKLALDVWIKECESMPIVIRDGVQFLMMSEESAVRIGSAIKNINASQPEQKPVAWLEENGAKAMTDLEKQAWIQAGRDELVETYNKPLYTTPQTKEWVGLTDEEREELPMDAVFITEAKLKEKNT
jgi:hypothetical protein